MNVTDVVLAPWHGVRLAVRAAEDLNTLAERARREPDPVVGLRRDLDALVLHLADLDAHTVELIDGGSDLTKAAEQISASLRVLVAAMPRLMDALGTVEELEAAVETVAQTAKPLAGVARGVGKLTGQG